MLSFDTEYRIGLKPFLSIPPIIQFPSTAAIAADGTFTKPDSIMDFDSWIVAQGMIQSYSNITFDGKENKYNSR